MTVATAITVLLTAWANTWDPALEVLTFPKYPYRELRPVQLSETAVRLTVALRGYGYKYRGLRPREPPVAHMVGIQEALNEALPPNFQITQVGNLGHDIEIVMEEIL